MTYRSDRRGETPEKPWPLEAVYPVGTPRANFIMARNSNVPFERPKIRMQSICHSTRKSNIRMLKRIFGKRIWDSCAYLTGGVQIRLPWYYLSATLSAQPDPRGLGACHATGRASRVASIPPFHPAEPVGARVARFPTAGSLPRIPGGSASASLRYEACAAFTSLRPAWSLNRPGRPFVIGVLQPMSLPPSSAPTATGWSDSCRAGFAECWELGYVGARCKYLSVLNC